MVPLIAPDLWAYPRPDAFHGETLFGIQTDYALLQRAHNGWIVHHCADVWRVGSSRSWAILYSDNQEGFKKRFWRQGHFKVVYLPELVQGQPMPWTKESSQCPA